MTVAELIEKLRTYPPTMLVVTPGIDETGYADLTSAQQMTVRRFPYEDQYIHYAAPDTPLAEGATEELQVVNLNWE